MKSIIDWNKKKKKCPVLTTFQEGIRRKRSCLSCSEVLNSDQRNFMEVGDKLSKQIEIFPPERIRIWDPKKTWPQKTADGRTIVTVTREPLFQLWAALPSGYRKSGQTWEDKICKLQSGTAIVGGHISIVPQVHSYPQMPPWVRQKPSVGPHWHCCCPGIKSETQQHSRSSHTLLLF